MYVVRDASQGVPIYLRRDQFLGGKPDSEKAKHYLQRRIGWQESSPQNNFRRIIAAAIPKGSFCNHKINYIPEDASELPLDFVLALLNSDISDWFFRLCSTNAAVSHYQIHQLPVPTIKEEDAPEWWAGALERSDWKCIADDASLDHPGTMPSYVASAIAAMCQSIRKHELRRSMSSRSERSFLCRDSEPVQEAINQLFSRCFGLSAEEVRYLEIRLREML
jgi:hypothetical protein